MCFHRLDASSLLSKCTIVARVGIDSRLMQYGMAPLDGDDLATQCVQLVCKRSDLGLYGFHLGMRRISTRRSATTPNKLLVVESLVEF